MPLIKTKLAVLIGTIFLNYCMIYIFLGAFYFILGNLSPQYRSVINMVQLVALCKTSLISTYGINRILQPFMRDLSILESVSTCYSY